MKREKGLRVIVSNIVFSALVMTTPLTTAMLAGHDVGAAALVGIAQLVFSGLFAWTSGIVRFEEKKKEKNAK